MLKGQLGYAFNLMSRFFDKGASFWDYSITELGEMSMFIMVVSIGQTLCHDQIKTRGERTR